MKVRCGIVGIFIPRQVVGCSWRKKMGQPLDRSRRVFGQLTSFEKAFPQLESAEVRFIETDFGETVRTSSWSVRDDGGQMPCGNPHCERGGYELDREVSAMLREDITTKTVSLRCRGDEGTPKGRRRGQDCTRGIGATITITRRNISPEEYEEQCQRILHLVEALSPGKMVRFDPTSQRIRFTVRDPLTEAVLIQTSGELFPDDLAKKSDEEVSNLLKYLSGFRM
jgi:hypothetical protein